jgi:tetratricopeptide (TPR) repeat protein
VARRGIGELNRDASDVEVPSSSQLWRQAVEDEERKASRTQAWEPDETWILEPEAPAKLVVAKTAEPSAPVYRDIAVGREGAPAPGGRRRTVPRRVVDEVVASAGKAKGEKLAARIADATYSYEKERYSDALRVLRQLVGEVPGSAAVWELYGLTLYRCGHWAQAASALETFKGLSGSYDQHPVLADCYRALRRYDDAELMWAELRQASPSGDVVAEGRIVAAGVKADRGDLAGAILMLEKASRKVAKPSDRHLRQWYALADLYERAGDLPRARDLFNRVASIDGDAFDVRARLKSLH